MWHKSLVCVRERTKEASHGVSLRFPPPAGEKPFEDGAGGMAGYRNLRLFWNSAQKEERERIRLQAEIRSHLPYISDEQQM